MQMMESQRLGQRVRIITRALVSFLRQFSTPHQLDTPELEAERVKITAEAINSRIATSATDEQISARLQGAFDTIMRSHKAATWPSPAHFVDAMDLAAPVRMGDDVESTMLDMMARWHGKFGDQMPAMGRPDRTQALIDRGVIASLAEARRCGYDLTPEMAEEARKMGGAQDRRVSVPDPGGEFR